MKSLIILGFVVMLAACTQSPEQVQLNIQATDGLKDCTYREVPRSGASPLHVVRCPYSATSVVVHRGQRSVVVEDPALTRERALSKLTDEEKKALGVTE